MENVTTILNQVFSGCSSLGEIYAPDTIASVHNTSFTGCTNAIIKTQANSAAAKAAAAAGVAVKIVTHFEYTVNEDGESVTVTGVIGDVTELVIPDEIGGYKVTAIKGKAFKNNTTLTSVVIGDNVTTINYEAFNGCANIKTVVVGSGVTTVGASAFANMTNLESITFTGDSVTFDKSNTFSGTNANLVVYGVAGSKVETMANTNGFTFVAL